LACSERLLREGQNRRITDADHDSIRSLAASAIKTVSQQLAIRLQLADPEFVADVMFSRKIRCATNVAKLVWAKRYRNWPFGQDQVGLFRTIIGRPERTASMSFGQIA
jgi:hypothetical protein